MKGQRLFPNVLYHGTDLQVFQYSPIERRNLSRICAEVSDYFYKRFLSDGMSIGSYSKYKKRNGNKLGNRWYDFFNSFQHYDSYKQHSEYYQYESFYVTTGFERAKTYARNGHIFGEQGNIAFNLYKAGVQIWEAESEIDPILRDKIDILEALNNKAPKPIVLAFKDIPECLLLSEKGEMIAWEEMERYYASNDTVSSFRCGSDFNINRYLDRIFIVNKPIVT